MNKKTAIGFILLQSLIYGIGDPISKYAYDIIPVYAALIFRYLLAVLVMLAFAGKKILHGLRTCPIKPLLIPSVSIGVSYLISNVAISLTEATTVAFLRSLSIVFTPILAYIAYRTRFSWKHLPVMVFIIIGLYLLCGVAENGISGFGLGEILSLVSAVLLASALVFGKKALEEVDPITLTAIQALLTALVTISVVPFVPNALDFSTATASALWVLVYMAIACTVGGYLLQNAALPYISARTVALIQCICPVLTAVFSFILIDEQLSTYELIGCGIILVGIVTETMLQDD